MYLFHLGIYKTLGVGSNKWVKFRGGEIEAQHPNVPFKTFQASGNKDQK